MKGRSGGDRKGFFSLADEALVSTDFETNPTSFTLGSMAGITLVPTLVKVVGWHDNE